MKDNPLIHIDVVILAGGLGTRLREVIGETQKAIVNINNKAFLLRLLGYLYDQGFRRVVLALGYKSEQVIGELPIDVNRK